MAKDNGFTELKKQIKENNIGRLYLFFGEEEYVKQVYVEKMKEIIDDAGFADFNHITIDEKDLEPDFVNDALESFPMMTERKLIIIKNSGIFQKAREDVKEFWSKRLKNIPDYVTLVFDETGVDKRSVLYKTAAKEGLAAEFEYLSETDMVAWVEREARRNKKTISRNSAAYMVGICDEGLSYVKNELNKLISFCDSEITVSDIERIVAKSLSVRVFDLTDAIMAGDADKAVALTEDFKTVKESAFKILYLLSGTFDKCLRTRLMSAEGASYGDIAEKTGIKPFLVRKYMENGRKFGEDYLVGRIMRVAEIDLSIKEGEIDEWTALEQYVLESLESARKRQNG